MSSSAHSHKDLVFVRDLFIKAITGVDAWHRPQPQPVLVSIWLHTDVSEAGSTDHLSYSLNYDVISRNVTRMIESGKFRSLEQIASNVAEAVLADSTGGQWATIHVKKPRALLRAEASEIVISRRKVSTDDGGFKIVVTPGTTDVVKIHKLQLVTIIGVNTIERLHRQNVVLDLTLYKPTDGGDPVKVVAADADAALDSDIESSGGGGGAHTPPTAFNKRYDFRQVVDTVSTHVEDSSYKTVEAFVTSVAKVICKTCGIEKATIRAEKPSAITFAEAAGVEITRTRDSFLNEPESEELDIVDESITATSTVPSGAATPLFPQSGGGKRNAVDSSNTNTAHDVYIAFGSNEGDPILNIEQSRDELSKRNITVLSTSSLYLSEPMFVTDQNKFYNGVFHCQTTLPPLDLLDALKDIESNALGRVKLIDNGPRTIDLDILLYDDLVMNHPRLNIPHIGMLSRSFVLQPLVELVSSDTVHPLTAESYRAHLEQIPSSSKVQTSSDLTTCIPLPQLTQSTHATRKYLEYDAILHRSRSTDIMAIINVTPDSFSDGGKTQLDNIVETACKYVSQGAKILDIGGMSTNPKSTDPGSSEELNRIVPAIKALRASPLLAHIPISIDTYRSEVAEAALANGADIINDISAGVLDPEILSVARKYKAPIILNHTRGTPQEMTKLAHYTVPDSNIVDNSDEAVIEIVGRELEDRVNACISAGLARWQIILDPGLGFAKTLTHNLSIIRNLDKLRSREAFTGLVWLLGPSRKRFIGTITGHDQASDRILGTAATITSLIAGGADIVRVHDIPEMADVTKMADAIYRNIY